MVRISNAFFIEQILKLSIKLAVNITIIFNYSKKFLGNILKH